MRISKSPLSYINFLGIEQSGRRHKNDTRIVTSIHHAFAITENAGVLGLSDASLSVIARVRLGM